MKVSVITLGCKVNEYESLSMLSQLKEAGYEVQQGLEVADIFILNTCAVTNIAERKSRQTISKILKLNNNAKIIVCGCASQNDPSQFYQYKNVYSVIGNADKSNIVKYINESIKERLDLPLVYEKYKYAEETKARKYIKIQDGCNNFCSYCIIPYTRGRSRSRSSEDIIKEIKTSTSKEIVLTGINVSDYKENGQLALIDLLEKIDKLNIRFRLSSFECVIINDGFIDRLKKLKNFCPFFHLSLQSACNATLKRMNRHYTIEQYIEVCKKLKNAFPSSCISTDLIVGFKGETEDEFNETLSNLQKIPFAFIHIFPYSVRQGTIAENFGGDVDGKIVKRREIILIDYDKTIYKKFLQENICTTHKVLIEEKKGDYYVGYSENYVYCYVIGNCNIGEIVSAVGERENIDGIICKKI